MVDTVRGCGMALTVVDARDVTPLIGPYLFPGLHQPFLCQEFLPESWEASRPVFCCQLVQMFHCLGDVAHGLCSVVQPIAARGCCLWNGWSLNPLSVHEMRLGLKWHRQTFSGCRGSSVYGRNLGTSAQCS